MVARELTQMDRVAQQYPAQALAVQCDLTDEQALVDVKKTVADTHGRLDILINCAGK